MYFVFADPGLKITGPTVRVLPPSQKECRNEIDKKRKKTLVCVATGFYPDHVSVRWEINGESVTRGVATDNAALLRRDNKTYSITSRLRVFGSDWYNPDNEFKCIVKFSFKETTEEFSDSIHGEQGMLMWNSEMSEMFATNTCK